jgi:hypothetical protein
MKVVPLCGRRVVMAEPGGRFVMTIPTITPAGWYVDPRVRHEYRYWNGTTWTSYVSDRGLMVTDSEVPSPTSPADARTGGRPVESPAPASAARADPGFTRTRSTMSKKKRRMIERAEPLLPSGTQIRQIVTASTRSPVLWIGLVILLAILPGALVFTMISKNRIIAVSQDAIYVLDCGHFGYRPKGVLRVLPRATRLGPAGGLWTKINAGPEKLWAGNPAELTAADAEAAPYGAATTAVATGPADLRTSLEGTDTLSDSSGESSDGELPPSLYVTEEGGSSNTSRGNRTPASGPGPGRPGPAGDTGP